MDINQNYSSYYLTAEKNCRQLYPTEFVVRAFLARYPRLHLDKSKFKGAKILDLGFGDGRNTGFLCEQGFEVFGVEITQEIVQLVEHRLKALGFTPKLSVGRNRSLPYTHSFFDYILACHSCYYLDEGDSFQDNLQEIARTMKEGATFIGSVPMAGNHYFENAIDLGNGMKRITKDPYGIRNGCLVMGLNSQEQLQTYLQPYFENIEIGHCDNDFWGIQEKVFTFACTAKSASTEEFS